MTNFNSRKIIQNIVLLLLLQFMALNLSAQYSLFSDVKAKKVGDIITVVLQESSQGSSTTDSRNISTNSLNANGGLSGNFLPFEPLFGSDAQFQSNSDASNLATQRQLLEGFLSVQVTELTPVGDLLVEGNRVTEVNGEIHEMKISGVVRQNDIHGDNQVYSYRIANASISYQKMGGLKDKRRASKLVNKVIVSGITAGLSAVAVMRAMKK